MARRVTTPLLTSAGVQVVVPLHARLRNDPLPVRPDFPKWPAIDPVLGNKRDQLVLLAVSIPDRLRLICDALQLGTINLFFQRWLSRLPLPLGAADQRAGYWRELSMAQVEVSRTIVFTQRGTFKTKAITRGAEVALPPGSQFLPQYRDLGIPRFHHSPDAQPQLKVQAPLITACRAQGPREWAHLSDHRYGY